MMPSRLAIAASVAVAILLPVAVWTSWNWGVAHRLHADLDAEVNTPVTGLRFRHAQCEAERGNLEAQVERQNRAVQDLQTESERRTAAANKALDEARRAKQASDARVRSILTSRLNAGETPCDAANRLILEAAS